MENGKLNIKAMMNCDPSLLKQVRRFEELAGERVILIHCLLKESVPGDCYILFTKYVYEIIQLYIPAINVPFPHMEISRQKPFLFKSCQVSE